MNDTGSGYESRPITKAPNWHGLVAFDLLLNNLATGLFLVAAIGELTAPAGFSRVASAAYPVALGFAILDSICLVLDLGDPLRFHHMLRIFKPRSPMSLGTWSLLCYSIFLTVIVATELFSPAPWGLMWVRKAAVIGGILPALTSALSKGVLLSTSAQPGWKDARWLGGYLANSAFMLGCSVMFLLSVLLEETRAEAILRPTLVILIMVNGIFGALLTTNLYQTLTGIYTQRLRFSLGAILVGLGMLLPLGLLLLSGRVGLISPYSVTATVMLLLLGNLVIRFTLIEIPHRKAWSVPRGA